MESFDNSLLWHINVVKEFWTDGRRTWRMRWTGFIILLCLSVLSGRTVWWKTGFQTLTLHLPLACLCLLNGFVFHTVGMQRLYLDSVCLDAATASLHQKKKTYCSLHVHYTSIKKSLIVHPGAYIQVFPILYISLEFQCCSHLGGLKQEQYNQVLNEQINLYNINSETTIWSTKHRRCICRSAVYV